MTARKSAPAKASKKASAKATRVAKSEGIEIGFRFKGKVPRTHIKALKAHLERMKPALMDSVNDLQGVALSNSLIIQRSMPPPGQK